MSTYTPKPGEIVRDWHVIDADNVILGRLAVQIANLLRGKHKPQFAPHVDTGDFVVVVNASKIALSGNKRTDSMRYTHSGRPGGLRTVAIGDMLEKDPRRAVERAVWGMLPKNTIARKMMTRVKVFAGEADAGMIKSQKPETITL